MSENNFDIYYVFYGKEIEKCRKENKIIRNEMKKINELMKRIMNEMKNINEHCKKK